MYTMKDALIDNVKECRENKTGSTSDLLKLLEASGSEHYGCANMYGVALRYIVELEDRLKEPTDD